MHKHTTKHGTYFDKLRLHGAGVDAFVVKERLDFLRNAPVVVETVTTDVRRRNDAIARQLPHMEFMDVVHAVNLINTIILLYRTVII